jgi:hypothetical protein
MEMISLQMPAQLWKMTCRCAKSLHVSRSIYIRCAIERMNRQTQAQLRNKRLAKASNKVRKESPQVNREFAAIERDPDFKLKPFSMPTIPRL